MEQILSRLLAKMNATREKMDSDQEEMRAEMETSQKRADDGQEEMKAHMTSLASQIEAKTSWVEGTEGSVEKLRVQTRKVGRRNGASECPA
jgi:signal transduction histidine kinase